MDFPSGIFPKILISGDYNAFDEGWNGCGVYACSGNYVSQTYRIPWYIGSTDDLRYRIENQHIKELNRGEHRHNKPLQDSWNKHTKEEGFVWWCLETCERGQELIREQYYFDLYQPFIRIFGGFNIAEDARCPMKGRKQSQETIAKRVLKLKIPCSEEKKQKISKAQKGRISPPEELARLRKLADSQRGQKLSEEHKIKIKENHAGRKKFTLLSPTGEIIHGECIVDFCKIHSLSVACMSAIFQGKQKVHKGWRLPENQFWTRSHRKGKQYALLSPDGKIFQGTGIKELCKEYNLNAYYLGLVVKGEKESFKGWTRAPERPQVTLISSRISRQL